MRDAEPEKRHSRLRGGAERHRVLREGHAEPRVEERQELVPDEAEEAEPHGHEGDHEEGETRIGVAVAPALHHLPDEDRHDAVPEGRDQDRPEELP